MGEIVNTIEVLSERGFLDNRTHEAELDEWIGDNRTTGYIGFDPTARSLHIGNLVPIMSLAHLQRGGHRPIVLVGGGTGLIGDPSGKTEMRQLLGETEIQENVNGIQSQLSRFLDFSQDRALMQNNADWLTKLQYIPFLRDIGRHFSVNRMIKFESYRMRLESDEGLTFIEFNYQILQAYDFLYLFDNFGCRLQMGGSDQWGNIVAGVELVRKMRRQPVFGVTFPLITTSAGTKMGKTAAGAVWLDPRRTSPYEYFQYWVNTDDRDVARFLSLYTFLPMTEIRDSKTLRDADVNAAKTVLAFETTAIVHGFAAAERAFRDAQKMFGKRVIPQELLPSARIHETAAGESVAEPAGNAPDADDGVPATEVSKDRLSGGIPAFELFTDVGLTATRSEARRLIEQGGAYVNQRRIDDFSEPITEAATENGVILLRAGKKRYHKIRVVG